MEIVTAVMQGHRSIVSHKVYYFAVYDHESFVGRVDGAGRNLVQVAYKCLMKVIDIGRLCGVGLLGGAAGSVCKSIL